MSTAKPVIEVAAHGHTRRESFEQWAEHTIQAHQVAREIAQDMLDGDGTATANEDQPEFYETYAVLDAAELRRQVAEFDEKVA